MVGNEISSTFIDAIEVVDITYQLVPPHSHRANLAERAIQIFKNHFKYSITTIDPNFPLYEWDRLIDQAGITLNLLRSAQVNPKLSAYAYIFGKFDYNKPKFLSLLPRSLCTPNPIITIIGH